MSKAINIKSIWILLQNKCFETIKFTFHIASSIIALSPKSWYAQSMFGKEFINCSFKWESCRTGDMLNTYKTLNYMHILIHISQDNSHLLLHSNLKNSSTKIENNALPISLIIEHNQLMHSDKFILTSGITLYNSEKLYQYVGSSFIKSSHLLQNLIVGTIRTSNMLLEISCFLPIWIPMADKRIITWLLSKYLLKKITI